MNSNDKEFIDASVNRRAGAVGLGTRRLAGLGSGRTEGEDEMAEEVVRWGILSAAKIAREWVAPGIHASARGRIAAIASRISGQGGGTLGTLR